MKQLSINVVTFDELSKEAKKIAKENIQDFLFDVLSFHVKEIKESKDEYLKAYHSGKLFHVIYLYINHFKLCASYHY